jgi:hypothetical protein
VSFRVSLDSSFTRASSRSKPASLKIVIRGCHDREQLQLHRRTVCHTARVPDQSQLLANLTDVVQSRHGSRHRVEGEGFVCLRRVVGHWLGSTLVVRSYILIVSEAIWGSPSDRRRHAHCLPTRRGKKRSRLSRKAQTRSVPQAATTMNLLAVQHVGHRCGRRISPPGHLSDNLPVAWS